MVHTFLLTLFFSFFFLFSLLNVFGFFIYLTVSFSMCGFARGFFCVMVAFATLQRWYCYSFCSKVSSAKQHEYDWNTSSFILIFANTGFLFPLRSFAFAAPTCLAPWTVLTFYIFNPISHLHVILHTSLPSYQLWMSNVLTL